MSHEHVEGTLSRLRQECLVGRGDGIEHASEVHEFGPLPADQVLECFRAADLDVEHEPVGLIGRVLCPARAAGPEPRSP